MTSQNYQELKPSTIKLFGLHMFLRVILKFNMAAIAGIVQLTILYSKGFKSVRMTQCSYIVFAQNAQQEYKFNSTRYHFEQCIGFQINMLNNISDEQDGQTTVQDNSTMYRRLQDVIIKFITFNTEDQFSSSIIRAARISV